MTKLVVVSFLSLIFLYFLFLLSSTGSQVVAKKLEYDVIKGGKVVGYMTTEKITKGDSVYYKIESETKFRILLFFSVYYILEEQYYKGELVSGYAESKLNSRTQKKSKVWRVKGKYTVDVDNYDNKLNVESVTYSVPEIYFSEPGSRSQVFSQQFAEYLTIKKEDDHVFTLYSEDGKNIYTYKNGVVTEAKINRTYATFYFRLKQ